MCIWSLGGNSIAAGREPAPRTRLASPLIFGNNRCCMQKTILTLALLFAARAGFAQCAVPKDSIFIGDSDVKAVLAAGAKRTPPAVDQQLRIVDLCKYNLAVGIIHRGPTAAPPGGGQAKAKAAPKQA